MGRCNARALRYLRAAQDVQRCYRGHLGRRMARARKLRRDAARLRSKGATDIGRVWRGYWARRGYEELHQAHLAAGTVQRCYRGLQGRRRAKERRRWKSAPTGEERLEVGVKLLDEQQRSFTRHKASVALLRRAQMRTDARLDRLRKRLRLARKDLRRVQRDAAQAESLANELDEMSKDATTVKRAIERLEYRERQMRTGSGGGASAQQARRDALRDMSRLAKQMGLEGSIGGGVGRSMEEQRQDEEASIERAGRLQVLSNPQSVEEKAEAGALRAKIAAREEERFEVQLALRMRRSEQQRLLNATRGRQHAAQQQVKALESACAQLDKQAKELSRDARRRERESSRLADGILSLIEQQQTEFRTMVDGRQAALEHAARKAAIAAIEGAQKALTAAAERQSGLAAAAAEREVTRYVGQATPHFVAGLAIMSAVQDGRAGAQMRALEFASGGGTVDSSTHAGKDKATAGGVVARVLQEDAAMRVLGFGRDPPNYVEGLDPPLRLPLPVPAVPNATEVETMQRVRVRALENDR